MPKHRLGYYGLRRWLMIRGASDRTWRIYWWFQPARCFFGWHNWYGVCAGEGSQCTCGAAGMYPKRLMREYRFKPWLRPWAARVREAEMRADMAYSLLKERWVA